MTTEHEDQGDDDPPLTPIDRLVIAEWRRMGYTIPAPELSVERRNQLINDVRQSFQRFEDRLAGKR